MSLNTLSLSSVSSPAWSCSDVGQWPDPRAVLAWHRLDGENPSAPTVIVRTWKPGVRQVRLKTQDSPVNGLLMQTAHPTGLFEACVSGPSASSVMAGQYQFEYESESGTCIMPDLYNVTSVFGELDLHLFAEGNHSRIYEKLGAHPREVDGIRGVNFAVWAPNARQVSVIGSFNDWDGRQHPMQPLGSSGIWELFIPQARSGDAYKFRLATAGGSTIDKADPYGFYHELPPRTASIVHDDRNYHWNDQAWLERRSQIDVSRRPMSVYEVHLGSWRQRAGRAHNWMSYRDLAHELVDYCREMNFTHIELMPISEHPYTGSWGYQTTGYYSATSRYGEPDELRYLIDHCHQNNIGVIIDWVPAHFPKDAFGLARFDGTALYEHADPRQGEHPDWNTLIFNYGRNEVRNFLVANALFWFDKFHIDGLRVDAVASMLYLDYSREPGQWIPNEWGGRENLSAINFLKQFNEACQTQFPGVLTIAEESTAWPGVSRPVTEGGLGFNLKWNMGWMNDTLSYMRNDPVHRKYHHDQLTFSLVYAFSENFLLPFSHDEVVHGKRSLLNQMPGDPWQKFANLRLLYAYMWTHPGKKLLFMGSEWGQWSEWNCNASLDWALLDQPGHRGLQKLVADLNRLYLEEPALHEQDFTYAGFEWVDCQNRDDSQLIYIRRSTTGEEVLIAANFTPIVRGDVRVGVPTAGNYRVLLNTDSMFYGGSNVGNGPVIVAEARPTRGHGYSLPLTLPPLGVLILKRCAAE